MHARMHTCMQVPTDTHVLFLLCMKYVHMKDRLFLEHKVCYLLPPFGRIGIQSCRRVLVLYNLWVRGVVDQLTRYRLQCIHTSASCTYRTTINEHNTVNAVAVTYSALVVQNEGN